MRNNKGQALIEFILVLPVFLLLILSIIDFGNIILKKYSLENELDIVSNMYLSGEDYNSYLSRKNIDSNFIIDDKFTNITLSKKVTVICPVLIPILGSKYEVEVEKSVLNDG